jgi:DNA polymerase III subunit delta
MPTNQIKPIYLISGDTSLLVQDERDKIRQTISKSGFSQREIITVDPGYDWQQLNQRLMSRSLFSEKTVIDVRLPKWQESASKLSMEYLKAPADDLVLLFSTAKLTSAQQKTKWYKAIKSAGTVITTWPINLQNLPQWIEKRLTTYQLQANPESIQLLAEWTEGNLLATQQAIEKLKLLYPGEVIDREKMLNTLNDNAHFTVFDLSNATLLGDKQRSLRILSHLRWEGIEPTLILWSLSREIRHLIKLLYQKERGTPVNQLIQTEWQSRKALVKSALQRKSYNSLLGCLQMASKIDGMIKGLHTGNYWNALKSLTLSMANSQ